MESEPLDLKKIKKLIEKCAKNYEIFGDALIDATFIDIRNHLKSAVQGLLQDIEREIKGWEKMMDGKDKITQEILSAEMDELEFCKDLVQRWFPDLIEIWFPDVINEEDKSESSL